MIRATLLLPKSRVKILACGPVPRLQNKNKTAVYHVLDKFLLCGETL